MKPLLHYAAVTYPKEKQFDELGEKVRDLGKTIRHMEAAMRDKQKQLEMQVELGNVYKAKSLINEELLKERNKQIEDLDNQLRLSQVEVTTQANGKEDELLLGEKVRDLEENLRHLEETMWNKQKQETSLINEELLMKKNKQIEELQKQLKLSHVEITTQRNTKEIEDIQKLTNKLEACENIVKNNNKFDDKYQLTLANEFQGNVQQNHKETQPETSQVLSLTTPALLHKSDEHSASRALIVEKHLSNNCLGKSTDEYISTVLCDWKIAGSGWTVIQRRQDGSVNFNRNWVEYKNGFGDLRGEFFIGLEKLYRLTQSQPHELYIHLEDFHNEVRYARYSLFKVGNESESYAIKSFGEYSGDADNALAKHKGFGFETPDRIATSANCAARFKSGWWFNLGCYEW